MNILKKIPNLIKVLKRKTKKTDKSFKKTIEII